MIEIKRNRQAAEEMPAKRAQKPAGGLDAQDIGESLQEAKAASTREIRPFMSIDARNYRAMYRAAFEYHKRHNLPQIDRAYWQTHKPGIDDTPKTDLDYWEQAARDMCEVSTRFGNDKFIVGLLTEIYNKLGREYEAARQRATGCYPV